MSTTSPDAAVQTMIANLPKKTGKSLQQWFAVLKRSKLEKHGELMKLLKGDHGVTHGFANLVVQSYRNSNSDTPVTSDSLVDAQYKGVKAELRPIYEAILKAVSGFGKDVEISPKKTYVSLRRSKQFALVQASTKDRVDIGINLKGRKPAGRLEASGSFNAMVSHRVRLTSKKDINAELKKWLKDAYDAA